MIVVTPGERDTFAQIERPIADDSFRGAGSGTWELFAEEWIGVRDQLPSRSEQPAGGIPVVIRRARIRMEWRDDITSDMRFVIGARVMQIVAGPAELGRRGGLEMMVEEYRPAGNPA